MASKKKSFSGNHCDIAIVDDIQTTKREERLAREESKRQRKEEIRNVRSRQAIFGYRNV